MKYIIAILITFSVIFKTKAQDTVIPVENSENYSGTSDQPYYFQDVNNVLNKFVGTWVFDDGTHFFSITFSKTLNYDYGEDWVTTYERVDILTSQFIYKLNGVEIYNTFTPNLPVYQGSPMMISGSNVLSNNLKNIILAYDEPSTKTRRSRSATLDLLYDNSVFGIQKLIWERGSERRQTLFSNAVAVDRTEFKIPSSMVLVKQ